jgi:hypothetical protein
MTYTVFIVRCLDLRVHLDTPKRVQLDLVEFDRASPPARLANTPVTAILARAFQVGAVHKSIGGVVEPQRAPAVKDVHHAGPS